MNKAHIPYLSVTELGTLLENSEVSPVEVTEAYLERIERINPLINAYITTAGDQAIADAKEAEAEIVAGRYRGPLHGIPFAIKDQFWTKGLRTTNGSSLLAEFVPEEDATVVARLKDSGGILLGKLNMSEFAGGGIFKFPSYRYGVPRNPWNIEHTTGGSSTGSGAATGGFLCATSLGEDTGGSVLVPASFCGLVGLRPTRGRVSRYRMFTAIWSMDTAGPISRTVEDCAITLQSIAGYDPKDPHTVQATVPDYRQALTGDIRGLRVGILKELLYDDYIDTEVRDSVLAAVKVLEGLGASVEEVSIPLMKNAHSYLTQIPHTTTETAGIYDKYIRERLNEYDHDVQVNLLLGKVIPAQFYYKAQRLRDVLRDQTKEAFKHFDIFVAQTTAAAAPKITPDRLPTSKEEIKDKILRPIFCTVGFALVGLPVASVPCGFTSKNGGLPIGIQIAGKPFAEDRVLNAAFAYQQSTSWHKQRPDI